MMLTMAADSIGTTIRKRRQVLGLTQQQLADSLGVSKSTVANWESGKHFPLRYAGAVEKALGIELDEQAAAIRPAYADPTLQRLYERLGEIDGLEDDVARGMVEIARVMLERRQRRGALSGFGFLDYM